MGGLYVDIYQNKIRRSGSWRYVGAHHVRPCYGILSRANARGFPGAPSFGFRTVQVGWVKTRADLETR